MNTKIIFTIVLSVLLFSLPAEARKPKNRTAKPASIEQWGRYEVSLRGPEAGNPFTDVELKADFSLSGSDSVVTVNGFYDGDGIYRVRFMPAAAGQWKYVTHSNVPELDNKSGNFLCTPSPHMPSGMVKADGRSFRYSDGSLYFPVGTTAYAWIHMPKDVQRMTINSLREAQFNKIRMCVFPKHYALCKEAPECYPYEILSDEHRKASSGSADEGRILGKGGTVKTAGSGITFNKTRFNPTFFRHLEHCLDSLDNIGCQADLILFHPYDKGYWGFDGMTMEENKLYLKYVMARVSSFRNVWWSLSNEYDYVKAKSFDDWVQLISIVKANDPYGHLVSIHGSTATYFPYEKYALTHTSIQDEGPVMALGRASILRNTYNIPVVLDEVRYEGNLSNRWGRMSGEEMLAEMWTGLTQGTYVTHGECYQLHAGDFDTIFWAKGGPWRGESWKRIPFMRKILADLPAPLQMADVSRDELTASAGEGYYLIYFRDKMQDSWTFNLRQKDAGYAKLKPGTRFKVEIIDTWNMTVTPVSGLFEVGEVNDYRMYDIHGRSVRLPMRPYLMLRIKRAE